MCRKFYVFYFHCSKSLNRRTPGTDSPNPWGSIKPRLRTIHIDSYTITTSSVLPSMLESIFNLKAMDIPIVWTQSIDTQSYEHTYSLNTIYWYSKLWTYLWYVHSLEQKHFCFQACWKVYSNMLESIFNRVFWSSEVWRTN